MFSTDPLHWLSQKLLYKHCHQLFIHIVSYDFPKCVYTTQNNVDYVAYGVCISISGSAIHEPITSSMF